MLESKTQHRLGNDGFIWFYGVVEEIFDDLKLGRVQVRILGDHTQSKQANRIPTTGLPWAYPINSLHYASMNGIGRSPTGLLKGTWVFGFYADGHDKQQPMILGSFGGIPEAIAWHPKQDDEEGDSTDEKIQSKMGFQDPDGIYPMGHHIFEQDTNRLARGFKEGAVEVPISIVPPTEFETEDGLTPEEPDLAMQYIDKFDDKYVKKYAKGEDEEVKLKDDDQYQFKLKNDHPFTVYKFINRERKVPIAKPFTDPIHREEWNEPQNPYKAIYPYNHVTEYIHGTGSTQTLNPDPFVTSSYGYNSTITGYDGSPKEGLHRKQKCGLGSWGLGEEWDTTNGAQRYHRFHPMGNYFEIDNRGNEVRKIYGDSFEIDLQKKTMLVKGDWNVTVEGNKNELIEGDCNLQVMGDLNTDVRGKIKTHCDTDSAMHIRGNRDLRIDGDDNVLIRSNRNTSVLVRDYTESQKAERHADTIIRKGATSISDEGFLMYDIKAFEMNMNICNLNTLITSATNKITTENNQIQSQTETIQTYSGEFDTFESSYVTFDALYNSFSEKATLYEGWIAGYTLHTDAYLLEFDSSFKQTKAAFMCTECDGSLEFTQDMTIDLGQTSYCETECINNQCKPLYNTCIEAAKAACMTTLVDGRTGKEVTRIDWEKYHASIDSCQKSYDACEAGCVGCTDDVCSPVSIGAIWECTPSHDPNCPVEDKFIIPPKVDEETGMPLQSEIPKFVDPWKELSQELP